MDAPLTSLSLGGGGQTTWILLGIVFAVVIGYFLYRYLTRANTMPSHSGFQDMGASQGPITPEELKKIQARAEAVLKGDGVPIHEGFYGAVARGAGIPDCLRVSTDGARLYALFAAQGVGRVEQGEPDLRELTLMLSQLSCFKKDLMGVAQQVEATRYQPFATQIDMEPIAETTARCFAKTIPPRDLDLAFDKWSKRGHFLIVRLCTAAGLNDAQLEEAETLFKRFIADIYDIAKSQCLSGVPTIDAVKTPRDVVPSPSYDITGAPYGGLY